MVVLNLRNGKEGGRFENLTHSYIKVAEKLLICVIIKINITIFIQVLVRRGRVFFAGLKKFCYNNSIFTNFSLLWVRQMF